MHCLLGEVTNKYHILYSMKEVNLDSTEKGT